MPEVRAFAAGSLRAALTELGDGLEREGLLRVSWRFAPAGFLRGEIEGGAECDLFASANREHPRLLLERGLALETRDFAANRLCISVRPGTYTDWESALGDAGAVVGTSTPGRDPGGDYAMALFDRLERERPGWGRELRKRARALMGGEDTPTPPPGVPGAEYLLTSGLADVVVGYASYAPSLRARGRVTVLEIPERLNVRAEYALACLTERGFALRDALLSARGKAVLERHGFMGPASALPAE